MARKALPIAVLVLGITALASARAMYRVEVKGARPVLAQDQPVNRGSMVLFHRFPDGRLVGVPQELVAGVQPAAASDSEIPRATGRGTHIRISEARVKAAAPDEAIVTPVSEGAAVRPLEPGEAILIGPTGSGSTTNFGSATGQGAYANGGGGSAAQAAAARAAVESQVFPGDLTTPVAPGNGGSNGNMAGTNVYGAGAAPVLNPTLTGTSTTNTNGTAAANSAPQSGTQPINPNGFPATTLNGPQSGTNPIGPNGFPTTTVNGPQSGTNPIGPNGFPTTAGSPQPGAAQPVNPNGFPSTAQPGQTNTTPRTTTGNRASSARVTGTGNAVTIVPANGGSAVITNSGQSNATTTNGTRATVNRAVPVNGNMATTTDTAAQPGTSAQPTTSSSSGKAPASSGKQ
ncbi:MAG TPA: hypothetical protein VE007_08815 [Thermoanaerobaculia bacterium]|nr:hypothetical protein [Thermoanaerobaculia bacterium]